MLEKITIVCVGNICRSPMAAGLLESRARQLRKPMQVASAGLDALEGHSPDPVCCELLRGENIDISGHQARQLRLETLRESDLILVMESWQKTALQLRHPECRGKIFTLGHWRGLEVEDPYRRSRAEYLAAWRKIKISVDSWSEKLW